MSEHNTPIKSFRVGNIRASIWENFGPDDRSYHSVAITRGYKDGEVWKDSTVFGRDDLPRVELVTRKAYEFISLEAVKSNENEKPESFAEKVSSGKSAAKSR